jgi:hypothetical protein
LIAVASLYGELKVRVCQKNMPEEEFRAAFPNATYGPGGSERSVRTGLSFTTEDDLLSAFKMTRMDQRRNARPKRLPRVKTAETTFLWAVVNSSQALSVSREAIVKESTRLARLCEVLLLMICAIPAAARACAAARALRSRVAPRLPVHPRAAAALDPGRTGSAGLSRSAFASASRDAGVPAMTYLRRHRLMLARGRWTFTKADCSRWDIAASPRSSAQDCAARVNRSPLETRGNVKTTAAMIMEKST